MRGWYRSGGVSKGVSAGRCQGGAPEVVESKKMRGLSRKMVELVVFEAVLEAMAPMESAVAKEKAKTQPERII